MTTIGETKEKVEFVFEWSIKHFSSLSDKDGIIYDSPMFSFANESWYLRILPNGVKEDGTEGCIDLYLEKITASSINLKFILGVKTVDEALDPGKHLSYSFEERGDMEGIDKLISRTELFKRKSDFLPSDTLTLVCRMLDPIPIEFTSKYIEAASYKLLREKKIFRDLKELFLKKDHSDVTIRVKEQEFSAHRNILAARSPVFESTFRNDMKEKQTGIVDIDDCDSFSFSDFLYFLYCGDPEIITVENVFSIFTTADKYDVSDLREKCLEFMKQKLCVDTFCDTITLALQYSETELIATSTDFFMENAIEIAESVKWQSYSAANPTQSNELFIKALKAAKNLKK